MNICCVTPLTDAVLQTLKSLCCAVSVCCVCVWFGWRCVLACVRPQVEPGCFWRVKGGQFVFWGHPKGLWRNYYPITHKHAPTCTDTHTRTHTQSALTSHCSVKLLDHNVFPGVVCSLSSSFVELCAWDLPPMMEVKVLRISPGLIVYAQVCICVCARPDAGLRSWGCVLVGCCCDVSAGLRQDGWFLSAHFVFLCVFWGCRAALGWRMCWERPWGTPETAGGSDGHPSISKMSIKLHALVHTCTQQTGEQPGETRQRGGGVREVYVREECMCRTGEKWGSCFVDRASVISTTHSFCAESVKLPTPHSSAFWREVYYWAKLMPSTKTFVSFILEKKIFNIMLFINIYGAK